MTMTLSLTLRTWLTINGFVNEGGRPMRDCAGYLVRDGRRFRIRDNLVDIGEPIETFDRWANSIERTISLTEFINEFELPEGLTFR